MWLLLFKVFFFWVRPIICQLFDQNLLCHYSLMKARCSCHGLINFCFHKPCNMLNNSNTKENSMINGRVSLFYEYFLKAFDHMICRCTSYSGYIVCSHSRVQVSQHPLQYAYGRRVNRKRYEAGSKLFSEAVREVK